MRENIEMLNSGYSVQQMQTSERFKYILFPLLRANHKQAIPRALFRLTGTLFRLTQIFWLTGALFRLTRMLFRLHDHSMQCAFVMCCHCQLIPVESKTSSSSSSSSSLQVMLSFPSSWRGIR